MVSFMGNLSKIVVSLTLVYSYFWGIENGFTYNAAERYQLLRDRVNLEAERAFYKGHDIFFNLSFLNTNDLKTFIESVSKSTKDEATLKNFLNKYDETEKILGINLDLSAPLPFFETIETSLFFKGQIDYFQAIMSGELDCDSILLMIPEYLPSEIKKAFTCSYFKSLSAGDDLVDNLPGVSAAIKSAWKGQYIKPQDISDPNVYLFLKAIGHLGFNFRTSFLKFFQAHFKIYGASEGISPLLLSYSTLLKNKSPRLPQQTKINLNLDVSLDYKNKKWLWGAALSNFMLSEIVSPKDSESLWPKDSPLIHVYGKYRGSYQDMLINHYWGIHIRSLYKAAEGLYLGTDVSYPFWKDRLSLLLKAQIDPESYMIGFDIQSFLINFNINAWYPLKTNSSGMNSSGLYNFNLRIHF
jgi:hypothetical protein